MMTGGDSREDRTHQKRLFLFFWGKDHHFGNRSRAEKSTLDWPRILRTEFCECSHYIMSIKKTV